MPAGSNITVPKAYVHVGTVRTRYAPDYTNRYIETQIHLHVAERYRSVLCANREAELSKRRNTQLQRPEKLPRPEINEGPDLCKKAGGRAEKAPLRSAGTSH